MLKLETRQASDWFVTQLNDQYQDIIIQRNVHLRLGNQFIINWFMIRPRHAMAAEKSLHLIFIIHCSLWIKHYNVNVRTFMRHFWTCCYILSHKSDNKSNIVNLFLFLINPLQQEARLTQFSFINKFKQSICVVVDGVSCSCSRPSSLIIWCSSSW